MSYTAALFMVLALLTVNNSFVKGSNAGPFQKKKTLLRIRKTIQLLNLWITDIDNTTVEFAFVYSLDLLNFRLKNTELHQIPHPFILFEKIKADSFYQ
jgi:hypothetical protein